MKDYLIDRTARELNELYDIYSELFSDWEKTWDDPGNHDKLYSCYVRLKIVAVLLRSCLQHNFIENISLKTKADSKSLKKFCNYCIHHSNCVYEDNRPAQDLEVYLLIDTDICDK